MIEINSLENIDAVLKKIDSSTKKVIIRPVSFTKAGPWSDLFVTLKNKGLQIEFFPVRKLNARDEEDLHFAKVVSECGADCHWSDLR